MGRPSTAIATAIWLHIAVAIEDRCRGWGPLDMSSYVKFTAFSIKIIFRSLTLFVLQILAVY